MRLFHKPLDSCDMSTEHIQRIIQKFETETLDMLLNSEPKNHLHYSRIARGHFK